MFSRTTSKYYLYILLIINPINNNKQRAYKRVFKQQLLDKVYVIRGKCNYAVNIKVSPYLWKGFAEKFVKSNFVFGIKTNH